MAGVLGVDPGVASEIAGKYKQVSRPNPNAGPNAWGYRADAPADIKSWQSPFDSGKPWVAGGAGPYSIASTAAPVSERQVSYGGKTYFQTPEGWGLNEGTQMLTPDVAARYGGVQMPDKSYLFSSDPKSIPTGVASGAYRGGISGRTKTREGALGVAGVVAAPVAGYFAAPALLGTAGTAGALGGGGAAAAGAGAAGGSAAVPASYWSTVAGADAATATDVTAGTTGAIGAGTAAGTGTVPMNLAASSAASNIITGPGGTATALGAGGGAGAGGVLGTGLSATQAGVLGAGLGASLLLGGRKPPEQGYLTNEQQTQSAQGQQLIQNAVNGKLTPAQQQQIDNWKKGSMASAKQYLINSGQTADSTAMLGLQQNIDAQALAISQGFLDQSFQMGLAEIGIADGATAQLINGRLIQQQQTGQALSNFMMAYGMMSGWGG